MNNKQNTLFPPQFAGGIERRYFQSQVEHRADGDGGFNFGGLASRTGVEYTMYEDSQEIWVEEINPAAFDGVLDQDVRVLINHDPNLIIARTAAGTAKVYKDEDGLRYSWQNDDRISYARDLSISIERGDVTQSSFGFYTEHKNNEFQRTLLPDGRTKWKRTINKFDQIYDVSPVTFPASGSTETYKRDFQTAIAEYRKRIEKDEQKEAEKRQAEIEIMEAINNLNTRLCDI